MFGSKLRSWMENHIVRPRKKGNKNKNGTSNNLATANGAQNGHKGTGYSIYQGDTTTATSAGTTNSISSPARRSEVSPIQSHTTSRFGWQSPKQETAMSPKSDHFLYVHTVKAHTLSSSSSLTTAATTIDSSSSHSTSAIAKKTKTLSPNNMLRKSSFSFMQDSNNTSSQKQQCCPPNSNNKQQQQFSHNSHQSQVHASHKKIPTNSAYHAIPVTYASTNQKQHEINLQNNNKSQSSNKQPIPKQTPPPAPPQGKKVDSRYQNGGVQHFDESRYGKILPSKRGSVESFSPSLGSYDSLNANIHFQSTQDEKVLPSNNNNGNLGSNSTPAAPKTNCIANGPAGYHQPPHIHHHHHHTPSQMPPRNGYEGSRSMLRTNRYNGNSMLGPPSNHPLAHVINSLSSPESAYSTGYSTDGTSPGATYTPPEYYINMRTGTHYFPKGVNTLAIEATRYKFGLNKIEEMSPQEPLPNNHRRTESFDLGQNKIPGFGIPDPSFFQAKSVQCQSPVPQASIVIPSYKGFESPSPRQRCRIRTNPWYSTTDTSSSGNSTFLAKKIEVDASSSSSGIKSSSDAGASDKNEKNEQSSDTETTSSSTEVEAVQRTFSPGTIRRRKAPTEASKSEPHVTQSLHQDSDEDATLNEMMGKFDESYVYEKETDILSDSDPTDCVSDLDTGQDAGDECDTDDLLDIDFIDNGSIQEIVEKEAYKNTGSCSYFNYQLDRRASRMRRSRKQNEDHHATKRKKRLMKTRKKSVENKDNKNSPIRKSRESRSLGGTPVCLRRNQSADNTKKTSKISPLTNRSNSLTFTEVHAIRGRFVAIAESEKALLKADLEADVKYKQLIHEAETILVSMKTCALRETPVASPRRICNPPPNKRVEMLRNYEADIKREASKQAKPVETHEIVNAPASVDGILVNKRLEMLRYETNSAPNSPKSSRFSPRKTHITNFINQNAPPAELVRRNSIPDSPPPVPKSPQLQLNGRVMRSPVSSPSGKRRVRSQSPRISLYSDSDSEEEHSRKSVQHRRGSVNKSESESNTTTKNNLNDTLTRKSRQTARSIKEDLNNRNIVIETEKITVYDQSDITNRNIIETKKPSLMSFRSIDMGNRTSVNGYCPQSEPLKRKIYKGSSSFERIKKSLDLESEIPKQAILEKISNLRKERQSVKNSNSDINNTTNSQQDPKTDDDNSYSSNVSTKHQLILNTIEDLKRSLEDQSVELCGLNDDAQ